MQCSAFEFVPDHLYESSTVAGRIVNGDIRVGDTFTELVKRTVAKERTTDGGYVHSFSEEFVIPLSITVVAIEAFHKNWDVLPAGTVAGLTLAGDGLDDFCQFVGRKEEAGLYLLRGMPR